MSGQQPRNIFQNFSQSSISNKIKQILSKNDQKGLPSPRSMSKSASFTKQRINTNPRPLTTQLQFQQQNQQQTFSSNNLQQSNLTLQNISRYNQIRSSIDSNAHLQGGKEISIRIQTSFPGSPSMSYTKIKNQQLTSTPSYSEFGDTKTHFGFQNLSNSTPLFNKNNMMISGGKQNNLFENAEEIQQQEIYVVHNSQGNKYRSKLNSQVKTKLNKKNEIIKQFLIKNMKPNESKGFQNWQVRNDGRYSVLSLQNSEQQEIQTSTPQNQTNSQQINPIIMLGGQNRQFVINDQHKFKRPVTSFLQRSKLLIPQTKANQELFQSSMIQISKQSNNIASPSNQIAINKEYNLKYDKPYSFKNQEIIQVDPIIKQQNQNKQLDGIIQNQQQSHLQQYQISNFLEQGHEWEDNFYSETANQNTIQKDLQKYQKNQSSIQKNQLEAIPNTNNHIHNQNKGAAEKKFKNQTEQTNFPDYNMNSLSSWQDQQSIEKVVLTQERDEFDDMYKYQSSEKEKINPTNFSQISKQVQTNQKFQQQQQQAQVENINLNSLKQQKQISSQKNLKVQKNQDNSRKKSIRGWSYHSDDEQINNQVSTMFKKKQL